MVAYKLSQPPQYPDVKKLGLLSLTLEAIVELLATTCDTLEEPRAADQLT
jgi:hypothetical protein